MALPVSLDEAKRQLRIIDNNDQDDEIAGFIVDAAGWVQDYTGHILEARDVTEVFRGYGPVALRAWPISAGAVPAGSYADASGAAIPIAGARLSATNRPALVSPAAGTIFGVRDDAQTVSVTVRAGYENPADVPRNFVRAMLILIGAFDDDREGGETFQRAEATAKALCRKQKAWRA